MLFEIVIVARPVTARNDADVPADTAPLPGIPATFNWKGPTELEFRGVIWTELATIRSCYESQLLHDTMLRGTTTVELVLAADGVVRSATGTGFHPGVDLCVAETIKPMKFPAAGRVLSIMFPFRFEPPPQVRR